MKYLKEGRKPKKEDRYIRADARWQGQPGRLTAIRNSKHKYVYNHDRKGGAF